MAITSRGRMASLARALVRAQQNQSSRLSAFENRLADPARTTDNTGEAVAVDLRNLPTTTLHASDFANGTVRLRQSGKYVLVDDVEFDPPSAPGAAYPKPPYQLGFFAAITVEAPNVVLDLGGHTLRQSKRHALRQRFFSVVELSDQPFLQGQGPSDFGPDEPGGVRRCIVENGVLGRSAHHGVHGNESIELLLRNLVITDFEVAAIHLNNPAKCTLQNVHVHRTRNPVPLKASYSQAVFARDALRAALQQSDGTSTWRGRSGSVILGDLEMEIDRTEAEVLAGQPVTNALFRNDRGELDGNCYGIVIHRKGVAVGPLVESPGAGTSVFMIDVCVESVRSAPVSVSVFTDAVLSGDESTYGANAPIIRGPVGDVVDVHSLGGPNTYTPTTLSEVQLYLAKHHDRGYVPANVLAWAEDGAAFPSDGLYEITGLDAMAHTMKGNIGVFLSGIASAVIDRMRVDGVDNAGTTGHRGDDAVGLLATGCGHVVVRDSKIIGAKTRGSEFRNNTRALLERTVVAQTPVPVLRDETSQVESRECGHAILVLRE